MTTQISTLRSFRRSRGEDGQILVMVALFMVMLLAMVGLAVDGGGLYALQRDAQNAADNAALAAGHRLCLSDQTAAREVAKNTLNAHGFSAEVTAGHYDVDFSGGDTVTVDLTAQKPNYFIRVINPSDLNVSVSATAYCDDQSSAYADHAIVGTGSNCSPTVRASGTSGAGDFIDGILSNGGTNFSGGQMTINGTVTMNRATFEQFGTKYWPTVYDFLPGVVINGKDENDQDQLDEVTFINQPVDLELLYDIDWFNYGSNAFNAIVADINADRDQAIEDYTAEGVRVVEQVKALGDSGQFHRLTWNGNWWNWPGTGFNPMPHKEGLIFVEGDFRANGGNYEAPTGKMTIVATGAIQVSASGWSFGEPAVDGISLLSWLNGPYTPNDKTFPTQDPTVYGDCDAKGIATNVATVRFRGLVYAPFSKVHIPVSDADMVGQVIGYSVEANLGNGRFDYDNEFLPGGDQTLSLVD